jgi:hypothetical protein
MAARIVVAQRQAEPVIVPRDKGSTRRREHRKRDRGNVATERYNHLFIL